MQQSRFIQHKNDFAVQQSRLIQHKNDFAAQQSRLIQHKNDFAVQQSRLIQRENDFAAQQSRFIQHKNDFADCLLCKTQCFASQHFVKVGRILCEAILSALPIDKAFARMNMFCLQMRKAGIQSNQPP